MTDTKMWHEKIFEEFIAYHAEAVRANARTPFLRRHRNELSARARRHREPSPQPTLFAVGACTAELDGARIQNRYMEEHMTFARLSAIGAIAGAKAKPRQLNFATPEITHILNTEKMRERISQQGGDAFAGSPDALGRLMREDLKKWNAVAKQACIKPE